MAQSTFSVRMDENLKKQFEGLCDVFGMNMSTAINVFARAVVRERKIPFEITETSRNDELIREKAMAAIEAIRTKAKADGLSNISLDDINEEIRESRLESK